MYINTQVLIIFISLVLKRSEISELLGRSENELVIMLLRKVRKGSEVLSSQLEAVCFTENFSLIQEH